MPYKPAHTARHPAIILKYYTRRSVVEYHAQSFCHGFSIPCPRNRTIDERADLFIIKYSILSAETNSNIMKKIKCGLAWKPQHIYHSREPNTMSYSVLERYKKKTNWDGSRDGGKRQKKCVPGRSPVIRSHVYISRRPCCFEYNYIINWYTMRVIYD